MLRAALIAVAVTIAGVFLFMGLRTPRDAPPVPQRRGGRIHGLRPVAQRGPLPLLRPTRPPSSAAPPVVAEISDAQREAVLRRWGHTAPAVTARLEPSQEVAAALATAEERMGANDHGGALEAYRDALELSRDPGERDRIRLSSAAAYDDREALLEELDDLGRSATRLDVQVEACERLDRLEQDPR